MREMREGLREAMEVVSATRSEIGYRLGNSVRSGVFRSPRVSGSTVERWCLLEAIVAWLKIPC